MKQQRLLYAPNIHQGGGKVLLLAVLEALKDAEDIVYVLDERMQLPQQGRITGKVYRVKPSLISRLYIEWRLRRLIKPSMFLLCMGNLPPFFVKNGIQKVFVQNIYLIDDILLNRLPFIVRNRLRFERWWLRSRSEYVDGFIVQTPTMQRLIEKKLGVTAAVLPFTKHMSVEGLPITWECCQFDYIYVASGESHKNHKTLVEAWVMLAERDVFPSLCLTLDTGLFPSLCKWISARIRKHKLNITITGECTREEVYKLYRESCALIYPSLFESFGLPLVEATSVGLPVLASNKPYVTDVIEPTAVFDPYTPKAIADAVQSFVCKPSSLRIKLVDVDEFISQAFSTDAVRHNNDC